MINGVYIDINLKNLWDRNSLDRLNDKNTDRVYIIDGRERSGKSTFAIQQACALEPSLLESPEKFVSRIVFTPEDFHEVIRNTKNGVIIFDEAFRGMSIRSTMSKVNKNIIQTLMEMGQNNNIVFIVLPSFFMLDLYPAMLRSDGLFNIYENRRSKRRCFRGWNRADKNRMYQIGAKKGWNYIIKSRFRGCFSKAFPGGVEFEKAYIKKKENALKKMFKEPETQDSFYIFAEAMRKEGKTWEDIGKHYGLAADSARIRHRRTNIRLNVI